MSTDALIEEIKNSYKHSNLKDLNLKDARPSVEQKLGYLLQVVPNLSNKDYSINFDPVENLFLNKLVSDNILGRRFVVTKEEYFKSIVFTDFLTSYVLNNNNILNDFLEITTRLEEINPYLDPDLELIVKYSVLHFTYSQGKKYISGNDRQKQKDLERYLSKNYTSPQDYVILRKLDPVHESLGKFVCDLVENEVIKNELQNASGVNDVKSLLFTDCVIKYLPDPSSVLEKVQQKHYYSASLLAMTELGKTVTPAFVKEYFQKKEEVYKK